MSAVAEILLAQIWNSQWFDQPLVTDDGRSVRVVYPGVWTHGFGPDFRDAMLDIDGSLVRGDVEVELEVRGWSQHRHAENDAFNRVILQVVARGSSDPPVRRVDGSAVPRVVLTDFLRGAISDFSEVPGLRPLGAIGFETCASGPAVERPDLILDICEQSGDRRMQERVAVVGGELAMSTPEQVLYSRLLDSLGFSRNRSPMIEVSARLTAEQLWQQLEVTREDMRFWRAAALLLGVGGFLPLSPGDASIGRLEPRQVGMIEAEWEEAGKPWHALTVSPGLWSLARIRPAAHPVRRLLAASAIVTGAPDGLVDGLLQRVASERPRRELLRWLAGANPYLGRGHAHEVIVNVVIPFTLAYGEMADQRELIDAAGDLWQHLPAGSGNAVTRVTLEQICGDDGFSLKTARAEQGLIHINRNGCSQMRCYECPVAHLSLSWERDSPARAERL